MGKVITPRVPAIGSVAGVVDPTARQILRALVDAHNTRNGDTESRFVTAKDVAELATPAQQATQVVTPAAGSEDERVDRLSGELTALQSTVARSNTHSTNDGYDVGSGTGQVPLNNGALNANLNADMLDGHHSGHAVGDVPVSDGVVCEELNADMLDGHHASAFVRVGAVVETTKTLTGKFMELVIGDQTYYLPLYQ